MSSIKRKLPLFLLVICLAGKCLAQTPDAAKGDKLLKQMSDKLAASKLFSFSTSDLRDKVKSDGKKIQLKVTRDMLVRRPDGVWISFQGDRDWKMWYDGKFITMVSDKDKVFVQRATPKTIDETMDFLAEHFDFDLPMSDLLYSSPYDSLMDGGSKGGYVGTEQIESASCDHLSYKNAVNDWDIWINPKDSLPCRFKIKYKDSDGQPVTQITFSKWNLAANATPDNFAFKIPKGYERIPILERIRLEETPETDTATKPNQK